MFTPTVHIPSCIFKQLLVLFEALLEDWMVGALKLIGKEFSPISFKAHFLSFESLGDSGRLGKLLEYQN